MRLIVGIFGFIWKVYIAIAFTVSALIMYPVITPFLGSEKGRKKAFKLFVFWSRFLSFLIFTYARKAQLGEMPEGPKIILANHVSYLDIFLMYCILPDEPFIFLGKSELLHYPLIKTYFKKMNIPVFRGHRIKAAKSVVAAIDKVDKGWSVMIFPEGEIPSSVEQPIMVPLKNGAFQIAKATRAHILPITFINHHKLFSIPNKLLGPARPGVSDYVVHPLITSDEVEKLDLQELNQKCFDIINGPVEEMMRKSKQ